MACRTSSQVSTRLFHTGKEDAMIKTREHICFALLVGVTIVTLLGSASKAIAFHPSGHIYKVLVKSSFGTAFSDCYRYNADGTLIIDGLGIPGVYDHDNLGANNRKTQGINADESFGLATHAQHGLVAHPTVNGDAISTFGDTFIFEGSE